MRKFSDILIRKHRTIHLNHYDDSHLTAFEIATNKVIQHFYEELKRYIDKRDTLEKEIAENYAKIHSYGTPEQFDLIDEQLYWESKAEDIDNYLDSLAEMKIVYLFKSLELTIKRFISYAYPTVDLKSFFKWENVKTFFKGQGIDISQIEGYPQCVELKKINNCIKHSGAGNDEIRSIQEFTNETGLHHRQLEAFYSRVSKTANIFCQALKEKIKDNLYSFSEERLETLASEYYERMNDETIEKFIAKLDNKLDESMAQAK